MDIALLKIDADETLAYATLVIRTPSSRRMGASSW
jgi:hypothetical protein